MSLQKHSLVNWPSDTVRLSKNWILLILMISMAACSSSAEEAITGAGANNQTGSFASANPCELMTAAEVESVFGEAATADTEPTSAGPIQSCTFQNDAGGRFFLLQIGPESAIEVDAGDEGAVVISDLGDEAVFVSGFLRVRVDDTVLQVTTWHPASRQDEALAMAEQIARMALE